MAKTKNLTQARLKELVVYDPATGEFFHKKSRPGVVGGSKAGSKHISGHIQIKIKGVLHKASRLAWLYVHGECPKEQVDHINGDPSDNRLCNLREATQKQNSQNRRRLDSNRCGYKGVRLNYGRYESRITVDGKLTILGYFDCPKKAHEAYCEAARKHHGQFARMN